MCSESFHRRLPFQLCLRGEREGPQRAANPDAFLPATCPAGEKQVTLHIFKGEKQSGENLQIPSNPQLLSEFELLIFKGRRFPFVMLGVG